MLEDLDALFHFMTSTISAYCCQLNNYPNHNMKSLLEFVCYNLRRSQPRDKPHPKWLLLNQVMRAKKSMGTDCSG